MATYTVRQQEVLEFISDSVRERGVAPTLEEIAQGLGGISRPSVLDHLRALERKGAIRRKARESRAIEVLDRDYCRTPGIPLAGTIAAGAPILAAEEVGDEHRIEIEEYLGAGEDTFLLRVSGDSMVDDHIVPGDLVLVRRSETARDGDVVVAIVSDGGDGSGEATLKRFYRQRDEVRLEPANATLRPQRYRADEVEIRGVVRGVIRRT